MDVKNLETFHTKGWVKLPWASDVAQWAAHAKPLADAAVGDPANAEWLRCQGTWFVGVNALPNGPDGMLDDKALPTTVLNALDALDLPTDHWDRAQVSVMYPGYPKPREGESDAAFCFRRDRDAAHVDGLLPMPPENRRFLKEPHAFVLRPTDYRNIARCEPFGRLGRQSLHHAGKIGRRLDGSADWTNTDLTDAYHSARRTCFETCTRLTLPAKPGEAYIIHRLALHGVAPWETTAKAPAEGRMIAYFRPELTGPITDWIESP